MKFKRFPRVVPYAVTPRKLAYARRAIQSARDRCPLFPELTDLRSADRRVEDNARHSRLYWQDMRDTQAASWREARRQLGSLRPSQRAGLLRYWQNGGLPGSPVYLLGCIYEIKHRQICYWHKLAKLRRLRLIGAGRLPKPWKTFQPANP